MIDGDTSRVLAVNKKFLNLIHYKLNGKHVLQEEYSVNFFLPGVDVNKLEK